MRVTYADDVVEETVLLAERASPPGMAGAFRRARNRAYLVADPEKREATFRNLHRLWFVRFGLDRAVEAVIAERPWLTTRLGVCRVLRAAGPQDEGADLFDRVVPAGEADRRPLLVIKLQPSRLLDVMPLMEFLRHELTHVSDMVDPLFGYRRGLPPADGGPSADNIMRDRYRVLWDVTIDGRLARAGWARPGARERRAKEFASAFPMLGGEAHERFNEWFEVIEPTHDALVEFISHLPSSSESAHDGRCPLCRFPVASLDPHPERLSLQTRGRIEHEHHGWHIEQGLCSQCLDLYEAHHAVNR